MSITSGVFTETQLLDVRIAADKIMMDDRIKLQYIARVPAMKALFDKQVARLNYIFKQLKGGQMKDFVAEIWWDNVCGLEERECTPCEFGGPKASTNSEEKELDYCKEVAFSINEYDYINNEAEFSVQFAKLILGAKKLLSEGFTAYSIGQLNTLSGTNLLTSGLGTVVGNNTFIGSTAWSANALSYFLRVADVNQFTNEWLLSGANLHQAYLNAKAGVKPEDNGDLWGAMPIVFDEYNVDRVNDPTLITYLLSQGSYAIGNKAYSLPGQVKAIDGNTVMTLENDENLPLQYDLFVKKSCDHDMTLYDAKLRLKAGFYGNPTGCDAGNTGILNFICSNTI